MEHGALDVGIPHRTHNELSRRILVPGEEDGVPSHLDEGPKRLVDSLDRAQETAHGARAREKVGLLDLEILAICQEGSHCRL